MARDLFRNLAKDFRIEFRSRFAVTITLSFSCIITLCISLVMGGTALPVRVQAIVLWIILYFTAMSGLIHIFSREIEQGTDLFLRLHASPAVVLASKMIFNCLFFFAIEAIVIPFYLFFMQVEVLAAGSFLLAGLLGGIALSAGSTLLAAIAARAGGKGALFTVISFPMLLPVLWVSTMATSLSLEEAHPGAGNYFVFLLAFSGLVVAISFMLFPFVWIDE